jgi:hypothetical protein
MFEVSPSSLINSIHAIPILQRNVETMVHPRKVYTVEPHVAGYQLQEYMTVRPNQAPYTSTESLYSKNLWVC